MSKNEPVILSARNAFDQYAGMGAGELPADRWSALQVELFRWQTKNFGGANLEHITLGVCEEAGELSHAVLKHAQRIRGMAAPEEFRAAAGDAIADTVIYLIQAATVLRLDFGTLVELTASEVMKREWAQDPLTAGGAA